MFFRRSLYLTAGRCAVALMFVLAASSGFSASKLSNVELNGVLHVGDQVKVSLRDRFTGESSWVESGGFFNEIEVREISPETLEVTLEFEGSRKLLKLKRERIKRLQTGPMRYKFDKPEEIAFDATQIMLFERAQELVKKKRR